MSQFRQRQLQAVAEAAAKNGFNRNRRRCFVSFHPDDADEAETFLSRFGGEFFARTIGLTDDDFLGQKSTDAVMDLIRRKYLGDTTVTIVLIGECTWTSSLIDWEIHASLRRSRHGLVNGLLAIRPSTTTVLKGLIEDAYAAPTTRAQLIVSRRALQTEDRQCP